MSPKPTPSTFRASSWATAQDTTPSYIPMAFMHNLMDKELYEEFTALNCGFYFRDVFPPSGDDLPRCKELYAT